MIKTELNSKVKKGFGKKWLAQAEKAANSVLKPKKSHGVSVALVGARRMRTINKKYRKKDRPTDVLSFVHGEEGFVYPGEMRESLGEVIICPEVAEKNAKKAGHGLRKEMQLLFFHGLLHLLGHSHGSPKAAQKMFKLQEKMANEL
jgi:probable rRNA maturation factor